jgi:hypothetical protein
MEAPMDGNWLLPAVIAIVVAVGVVVFLLSRIRGSASGSRGSSPTLTSYNPVDGSFSSSVVSTPTPTPAPVAHTHPRREGDSKETWVQISHPMILRAARQALERGDEKIQRFVVQEGDKFYFSFDSISDPVERQRAYDLMSRFEAGEVNNIRDLLQLVQRMVR